MNKSIKETEHLIFFFSVRSNFISLINTKTCIFTRGYRHSWKYCFLVFIRWNKNRSYTCIKYPLFKCDVGHIRKSMFISCFLKTWPYHQYKFQIFVAICCIANTITLSNMNVRFIALNLGTPDRFRKGCILSSSCGHAVLQPFDYFNRRMFVQRIRKNFWVSCRNFGGIPLMRSRIVVFFKILYIFCVTRGTCHFDVSS